MKQKIHQLRAITVVVMLVCSLAFVISFNATANCKIISVQTIDDEPTEIPMPTVSASPTPTPQPTAVPSVFSFIMANFDILGLARLILIALGILWVIVIIRALDKNFGRKNKATA